MTINTSFSKSIYFSRYYLLKQEFKDYVFKIHTFRNTGKFIYVVRQEKWNVGFARKSR